MNESLQGELEGELTAYLQTHCNCLCTSSYSSNDGGTLRLKDKQPAIIYLSPWDKSLHTGS